MILSISITDNTENYLSQHRCAHCAAVHVSMLGADVVAAVAAAERTGVVVAALIFGGRVGCVALRHMVVISGGDLEGACPDAVSRFGINIRIFGMIRHSEFLLAGTEDVLLRSMIW